MKDWFYVTMTWDEWPEGGSFGTMIEANDHEEAETLCILEMAEHRAEEWRDDDPDDPKADPERWIRFGLDHWHVVDCMRLRDFIRLHADKIDPDWLKPLDRPVREF